jgi:transposase
MVRRARKAPLFLTPEEREELTKLSRSRTAPKRESERASILLLYADGEPVTGISRRIGVAYQTIYNCIDKALAAGPKTGLKDAYHRPRAPVITPEAIAWVVSIACTKPKEHDLAAELWTLSSLAGFIRERAIPEGHPCLARAAKATIWRILNAHDLKPHRIQYYLERRDPDFDRKMQEVLVVYEEVAIELKAEEKQAKEQGNDSKKADLLQESDPSTESALPAPRPVYTVSVDEKPGVQAIATTAPDLAPVPGKYSSFSRDYEYVRHGTVSLLSGIDLHDGHIFTQVHDRHRSIEFISLLKELDEYYPSESTIRLILDNHSAHISKETMAYLATRPGRFTYVHTPTHGSWLNIIESVFSKMARSFLRHIRVRSKAELKKRILQGVVEMNAVPVIFRWGQAKKKAKAV